SSNVCARTPRTCRIRHSRRQPKYSSNIAWRFSGLSVWPYSTQSPVFYRVNIRSQIPLQFGDECSLRIVVEIPISVIIDVVYTERCRPLFGKLIAGAHIDDEKLAYAGIGVAVRIAVVERAVLLSAVTRAHCEVPCVSRAIGRQKIRAPTGH